MNVNVCYVMQYFHCYINMVKDLVSIIEICLFDPEYELSSKM